MTILHRISSLITYQAPYYLLETEAILSLGSFPFQHLLSATRRMRTKLQDQCNTDHHASDYYKQVHYIQRYYISLAMQSHYNVHRHRHQEDHYCIALQNESSKPVHAKGREKKAVSHSAASPTKGGWFSKWYIVLRLLHQLSLRVESSSIRTIM